MAGAFDFAILKSCLTRDAPTPTIIYTNSEPDIYKKLTPAYLAVAFAIIVFPVPGGPVNNAPLGSLAPTFLNLSGFLRKSTNSKIYCLAWSCPATSSKLILISFGLIGFIFLDLGRNFCRMLFDLDIL